MGFFWVKKTDIGTARNVNQDCIYANSVKTQLGQAFLGVVCDGVGGLSDGEIASNAVVSLFSSWFEEEFKYILSDENVTENVKMQWEKLINTAQRQIGAMIKVNGASMGTTLSALLIIEDTYVAAQIGDSRIYRYNSGSITNITTDHSVVMEMVQKGLMTYDEASTSKKKNMLTRCIGPANNIKADYFCSLVRKNDCFFLSSDGFHGGLPAELLNNLVVTISREKNKKIEKMIDLAFEYKKFIGEKDNISLIFIKII